MPRVTHVHEWSWIGSWYVCTCGASHRELSVDHHDGGVAIWFRRPSASRPSIVVEKREVAA